MQALYRSEGIPAMQNKLYPNRVEALHAPSASLELVQDKTGFVFNQYFDSSIVTYDENYQNDQGYSSQFQEHLNEISAICRRYLKGNQNTLVDVGCGKGGFVELLRSQGVNAIGYDNAYQGNSPYIRKSFFSKYSHDKGDLLTLRHVLEHVPSPWQFLECIAAANDYKGLLYIEVPNLEWILENRAYFDLFHEHVNYFREVDFLRSFGKSVLFNSTSFGGQYLSIIIKLQCFKDNLFPSIYEDESYLYDAFVQLIANENQSYASLASVDEIVIWGAGAKGVVFAAKAPSSIKNKILFAIDINPKKQGCFMPVSGVEVFDPNIGIQKLSLSTLVIIMNSNYEEEIRNTLPLHQSVLVLS